MRADTELTLAEIARQLGIPKSTLYYWVRDLPVATNSPSRPTTQIQRTNQRAATAAMQTKYAAKRQEAYTAAYEEAGRLLADVGIRDFVVLYLAEGFRKSRNTVSFSNSNPRMIAFAHSCMRRLATNQHFRYSFQYHADQDPEQLKRFWADCLQIDPDQIHPTRKTNSGQLRGRRFACEYGVFMIQVGDTILRARLQALMDVVQEQWEASSSRQR